MASGKAPGDEGRVQGEARALRTTERHGRAVCSAGTRGTLVIACLVLLALWEVAADSTADQAGPSRYSTARHSSSALVLTGDSAMLLAVNPDSNSLSLVDTRNQSLIAELPVGFDPRTVAVDGAGERAYVANRGSDSISVIDLAALTVITELVVGPQPYGILVTPAGDQLFVAEQGADQVRILDAHNLAEQAVVATIDRPSGLGLSRNQRNLYVTHLLTNTITVLTLRPYLAHLPFISRGSSGSERSGSPRLARAQVAATVHLQSQIALWPDSNLVQSIAIAPDGLLAYIPHTRSNTGNRNLDFSTTVDPLVSLIDLQANKHLLGEQFNLGTLDPPGVGLPFDAAVTPDGGELWVVNAASNDLTVINLISRQRVAHIETGDNPRGIVLSSDGSTAYVNNTLVGTVSVIDTNAYTVTAVITVTEIPLPPLLLNGKRLFHSSDDPRMARAQWISCNTCHFDGEHDGRTWFFGFAGPRNTTSLLGMIQTYPLRWSGEWDESADAEFANLRENFGSGLLEGEINCSFDPPNCVYHLPNQGRSLDLDSLAAFIDSLPIPLSPTHRNGEPLRPPEQRGKELFDDPTLGCVTCHPPPLYTDLQLHDVGTETEDERIGPAYDTPSLRGLYGSAPYFHDGSAATLMAAITRPSPGGEHDVRSLLTEVESQDLVAFLLALPYEQ